jgi:hypothetical protein
VLPVLKGIVHVDNEGMFKFGKKLPFIENGVDALFGDNFAFHHLLQGVYLFVPFEFYAPDFAKASFADDILIVKMHPVYLFGLFIDHDPVIALLLGH